MSRVRSDQGHSTPMGEIPEPSCKLTPEARRCGFGMLRGDAGSNHQYTHQEEHVCAGTKISGCLYEWQNNQLRNAPYFVVHHLAGAATIHDRNVAENGIAS